MNANTRILRLLWRIDESSELIVTFNAVPRIVQREDARLLTCSILHDRQGCG